MNQPTLTFLNHDKTIGGVCPHCFHIFINRINEKSSEYIGIFSAPIVIDDRNKALAYECSECFEIAWFHWESPDKLEKE